jgi:hypothetical protein
MRVRGIWRLRAERRNAAACAVALVLAAILSTAGADAAAVRSALDRAPWWAAAAADGAIEGYASQVSALPGDTVDLRVSVQGEQRYRVVVYRLGDRTGRGDDELLACLPSCTGDEPGRAQAAPVTDADTGLIVAPWTTTDRLFLDPSWRSGYLVVQFLLTSGPAAGRAAWTPLILREAPGAKPSAILLQIPTNTLQAYNDWGGKSTYVTHGSGTPATKVSFDRPYAQTMIGWEYPLIRYLESRGYDVGYQTVQDTDRDPGSLQRHRLVIVDGHDEYWTSTIRDGFETARDAGTNLLFFGANIGYWQVRYEDGGRTMVAYKATAPDPVTDPRLQTSLFRQLGRPECTLLGVQHQGGRLLWGRGDYTVNKDALGDPWFAGTGFAAGDTIPQVVSAETDTIPDWLRMQGKTCLDGPLTIFFQADRGGDTFGNATFVRYVAPSGARVASVGTLELGASIDDVVQRMGGGQSLVDTRMQRFLGNALADLTRPARVVAASVVMTSGGTYFRILGTRDARTRVDVYASSGARRPGVGTDLGTLVCHDCPGRFWRPRRAGATGTYTAVSVDQWGASLPKTIAVRPSRRQQATR